MIPWARWDQLAWPKLMGGWGLKYIFLFSTNSTTKVVWRLIKRKGISIQVVKEKYIYPKTINGWIRREDNNRPISR